MLDEIFRRIDKNINHYLLTIATLYYNFLRYEEIDSTRIYDLEIYLKLIQFITEITFVNDFSLMLNYRNITLIGVIMSSYKE